MSIFEDTGLQGTLGTLGGALTFVHIQGPKTRSLFVQKDKSHA